MEIWIPIPVGERRQWIEEIQDISADSQVQCFILASSRSCDGPWTYALFVLDPRDSAVLTAYFVTVDELALEGGYNPLDGGSGISLTPEEAYGFVDLLEKQLGSLSEGPGRADVTFRGLDEGELTDLHIYAWELENHQFYRQVHPHGRKDEGDLTAIIMLSRPRRPRAHEPVDEIMSYIAERTGFYETLYFKAMQFLRSEFQDPNHRPDDYALPRLFLDRNDIQALIALFRQHLA